MPPLSRASALSLLLCALLLTACGTSSPRLVDRQPDASLLLPCADPVLAPGNATDNDIAAERIRVAQAYVTCRTRHAGLVEFVRGKPGG